MKRFHFPLQTIHAMREMRRDEAEKILAAAMARVNDAAAALAEAERVLCAAAETYAMRLQTGVFDQHETAMRASYLTTLSRRADEARVRLAEAERECETHRATVIAAARDHEATTRLRARHLARHELEMSRHEQNMLDEMATLSSARRLTKNL